MKVRKLTQKRKNEILPKANELVNQAVPLSQILKRCSISYRQLFAMSNDPAWQPSLIWRQGYKTSPFWMPLSYTKLMRDFVVRQYACRDLTIQQLSWLFGRSTRTIYRYIKEHNTKQTKK